MRTSTDSGPGNLWPLGPVLALPAALLAVGVVSRAWAECGVGVNASADNLTLMFFVLPALWVAEAVLTVTAIAVAAVRGARWPVQIALAVAVLAVLTWCATCFLVAAADEWPACPPRGRPDWLFWVP